MKKKVTMQDIADEANVSLSTVSLCLNNTGRISNQTRKKILEIAEKLNYVPNLAARELAGKSSDVIGIVLPHYGDLKTRELLEGISEASEKNNYFNLFCFTFNKMELGQTYIHMLEGKNIDALIVFPYASLLNSLDKETFYRIIDKGIPTVFVDTYQKDSRIPYVVCDNYKAAYNGTKYLIENGHSKIAYIGGVYHSAGQERVEGYSDAMKEKDLYNETQVYIGCNFSDSISEITEAIEPIFSENDITALMAYSKNATLAVMQQAKLFGKQNSEFEIIGFDLFQQEMINDFCVYSYHQPHYEMGIKVVELVLDKIQGKREVESRIRLDARLEPLSISAKQKFAKRKTQEWNKKS